MVGFLLGIISCLEVALWQINVVCVVAMGGVGGLPSSSLSCYIYLMDFYASGLRYSLGYARISGEIVILLASMALESYFKYLEFDSRLLDVDCLVRTKSLFL